MPGLLAPSTSTGAAERQRARVAAVGAGGAARARAVGRLADEHGVGGVEEDEVRGALTRCRSSSGRRGGPGRRRRAPRWAPRRRGPRWRASPRSWRRGCGAFPVRPNDIARGNLREPAVYAPTMPVPLFDTKTPLAPLRPQIDAKIAEVVDRGTFILGPEVAAFESEFAAYLGARHAAGVANGTDALVLALRALGVGPGDEVIVPSFTFYASAEAIPHTGARPVFCDVDPDTAASPPRPCAPRSRRARRPSSPCTCSATSRRSPRSRRSASRSSRTPRRRPARSARPAARRARHDRDVLVLPVEEPRRVRRRGRGHDERRRSRRADPAAALPRLQGQGHVRARRPQLPARRAAGGDPARPAAAPRRLVRRAPRRRRGLRARRPRRAGRAAAPRARLRPGVAPVRRARRGGRLARRGPARRGHRPQGLLPVPAHRQPAMAEWGAGVELPATEELARTHVAIPLSPVLTDEQAAEVVGAVRSARLQHQ